MEQGKGEEDKVWVTVEKTVNLGNYESFKIIAGLSQTRKPDDDATELIETLIDNTMGVVQRECREYKKQFKLKRTS